MDLSKLTLGEKIVGGAGIVLVLDLLLFPWHDFVLLTRTGIQSPNSFWGILALLVTIAMVAVVILTRFTTTKLPDLPVPLGQAMFFAGCAVAGLLLLKLVVETRLLAFGAFLAVLLGGAMAYGGFLMRKEAGDAPAVPPMGSPGA